MSFCLSPGKKNSIPDSFADNQNSIESGEWVRREAVTTMVMLWVPESNSHGLEAFSCVTLDKLLNLSQASISSGQNEDNRSSSLKGGCED